jgi:hypothetical protein
MLYLFAIINLILTSLSGLAFFNIYKSTNGLGWLEISVMFISLTLLLVTNIGIIWVNTQRGSVISELKRKNNMLEQELAEQKLASKEKKKDIND